MGKFNYLMKHIFLISVAVFLSGCYKTEYSEELPEKASIVDVVYSPSQHGSGLSPGLSTSGNMTMSFTDIDIPEVFATVFECQHGKFIISRKDIWQKSNIGDKVIVRYKEEYRVKGNKRTLHKLDFIDFTLDK